MNNRLSPPALKRYWRTNLTVMLALLGLWALVSVGLSILAVEGLNQVRLGGFPLGFWFAQQGSILVFILLIGVYALVLNRLDDAYLSQTGDGEQS